MSHRAGDGAAAAEPVTVPEALAAHRAALDGDAGRAWTAALPRLAAGLLERWELRRAGPAEHGMVALVLPVVRADGTPAALKLTWVDEESAGEPAALRAWNGDGAVRLLDHDPASGALLLERLDPARSLASVADPLAALRVIGGLLARLNAADPPPGLRRLEDSAAAMLREAPAAVRRLRRPEDRRTVTECAAALREVAAEPGDRLLHWDLHYENVLAPHPGAGPGREPWLAIDPKPLVGDPCFELLPALRNRFAEVTATGDVRRAVLRRFDVLTEAAGLDRERARCWTLARVLQEALWSTRSGRTSLDPVPAAIATTLLSRNG